jgi:hypothetical protein
MGRSPARSAHVLVRSSAIPIRADRGPWAAASLDGTTLRTVSARSPTTRNDQDGVLSECARPTARDPVGDPSIGRAEGIRPEERKRGALLRKAVSQRDKGSERVRADAPSSIPEVSMTAIESASTRPHVIAGPCLSTGTIPSAHSETATSLAPEGGPALGRAATRGSIGGGGEPTRPAGRGSPRAMRAMRPANGLPGSPRTGTPSSL